MRTVKAWSNLHSIFVLQIIENTTGKELNPATGRNGTFSAEFLMDGTQHPITTTPFSEFEFSATDASNLTKSDVMTTTHGTNQEVPSATANFTTEIEVSTTYEKRNYANMSLF